MSLPEWIPAKSVTFTVESYVMPATDCECMEEVGVVEVTNTTSQGNYEEITDITKRSIRGTIVIDSGAVHTFTLGLLVDGIYSVTGEKVVSGKCRVNKIGRKNGPKGAFLQTIEANFTGPVTVT